ncbi:MAG: integrin alpha [candidate division Zixibacteria bacterium]|nr:integrin alpha [candidate division Zixibacteria bacterium]MCI0595824.1 integrin alpha [candidate division Zixibacteria bacterium]
MRRRSHFLISSLLFFVIVPLAHGFDGPLQLLYQIDAVGLDQTGFSVAGAGDVNRDGRADFIVGAPSADPNQLQDAGSAFVYSGADGALLFQKDGGAADDGFGWSVAGAGDVNGDAYGDFIIGAPFADPDGLNLAGSVYVYSGASGDLLFQKNGADIGNNLGYSAAGAGDVDRDGSADFIVGAPFADPFGRASAGSAYVYSGASGGLLFQKNGAESRYRLGTSVAGVGDVDRDGKADFIIGAPGGLTDSGKAYVYSGEKGFLLFRKRGAAPGDRLGNSVAGAGDVNGDGHPDFIVGAYLSGLNGPESGAAYLYSGYDGALLFSVYGEAIGDRLGSAVAGAGDVNGDWKADFIVGAYLSDATDTLNVGAAYLYSGADGALLFQKKGLNVGDRLGTSVSGIGEVNGDGNADFIFGSPSARPDGINPGGQAFVYAFACPGSRGDLNTNGLVDLQDVILQLNCVFERTGNCNRCLSDANCDGNLTPADLITELYGFFAIRPIDCTFGTGPAL